MHPYSRLLYYREALNSFEEETPFDKGEMPRRRRKSPTPWLQEGDPVAYSERFLVELGVSREEKVLRALRGVVVELFDQMALVRWEGSDEPRPEPVDALRRVPEEETAGR
jgi:hypothetical protein